MWHVSSRSGVVTLRTAIHLLLTYLLTYLLIETQHIQPTTHKEIEKAIKQKAKTSSTCIYLHQIPHPDDSFASRVCSPQIKIANQKNSLVSVVHNYDYGVTPTTVQRHATSRDVVFTIIVTATVMQLRCDCWCWWWFPVATESRRR